MKRRFGILLAAGLLLMAGCAPAGQDTDGGGAVKYSYTQIGQDEAAERMARDDGHVVVDVRRQDEYDAGHIPGAILIPNESIGTQRPAELPDLDQIILIYCRSGNRSKQASQKLCDMGYTNVFEFGGINTWTGEIVTEETQDVEIEAIRPRAVLVIAVNERIFYASFADSPAADALRDRLNGGAIALELRSDGGGMTGTLPWTLPGNDGQADAKPGDLIGYQGDRIAVCCEESARDGVLLARIGNVTGDALREAFGEGGATAVFSLEWSE